MNASTSSVLRLSSGQHGTRFNRILQKNREYFLSVLFTGGENSSQYRRADPQSKFQTNHE